MATVKEMNKLIDKEYKNIPIYANMNQLSNTLCKIFMDDCHDINTCYITLDRKESNIIIQVFVFIPTNEIIDNCKRYKEALIESGLFTGKWTLGYQFRGFNGTAEIRLEDKVAKEYFLRFLKLYNVSNGKE